MVIQLFFFFFWGGGGGSALNLRVHFRVFLKVNVQNGNIFGGKYFCNRQMLGLRKS